ncbi:MAG: phosphatase domain-containing protein, partial [bacterium]
MSFLRHLLRVSSKDYKLRALVSARTLEPMSYFDRSVHVFCDLDKTYLETEFESWIKMAKIPFESPHDKITVPGASEVLELVRWGGGSKQGDGPRAGLHFVSSSPPQLRLALDGKLTLDRLEWSSDTFKNQTYNLRMGRLDLLRHHIAYKTKAILDIALKLTPESRIVMIGDNAEYDPFIYTGVRLLLEKRFDLDNLRQWLAGAMVELPVIEQVISNDLRVPDGLRVEGVYIRSVPSY